MKMSSAKSALRSRLKWLKEQKSQSNGFILEEIAAINLAMKCIEIVSSYGMVAVGTYGYPVFAGQLKDERENWQAGKLLPKKIGSLDYGGNYNTGDVL